MGHIKVVGYKRAFVQSIEPNSSAMSHAIYMPPRQSPCTKVKLLMSPRTTDLLNLPHSTRLSHPLHLCWIAIRSLSIMTCVCVLSVCIQISHTTYPLSVCIIYVNIHRRLPRLLDGSAHTHTHTHSYKYTR